jgi:hypothetical protein
VTFDVICCVPPVCRLTADGETARPETSELAGPTVTAALARRFVFAVDCAVMTAVRPAAVERAVTRPDALTVATVVSDEAHVTVVAVFAGAFWASVTVAVSWPEPPGTSVRLDGLIVTAVTALAGADTVTGIEPVTVWPPLVIVKFTAPAPAAEQVMVTLLPVCATVNPEPLAWNVTVGVPVPPATEIPAAVVVPATHATEAGFVVKVMGVGVTVTSSPHAARPKPAAAMASERQLTSLIR